MKKFIIVILMALLGFSAFADLYVNGYTGKVGKINPQTHHISYYSNQTPNPSHNQNQNNQNH